MKKIQYIKFVLRVYSILLVLGLAACTSPEEQELNVLRNALEKNQELSLKLVNYNRSISDDMTASFMRENFQDRIAIIGSLSAVNKTEKGAIGKIAVENFLKTENAYSESMALASLAMQRAYAIGGTGFRRENSSDRTAENYVMRARQYRADLKAQEVNLEVYGWKKTWGREAEKPSVNSVANSGKPEYLDGTQWQYLQKFELKTLLNTNAFYSWIAIEKTTGSLPRALVAVKKIDSPTMPVFTERFFCDERKVMIESAVRVVGGYAFPIDSYTTTSPIEILPNTAEDAAYNLLCPKKSWWQTWSLFKKSNVSKSVNEDDELLKKGAEIMKAMEGENGTKK